MSKEIERLRELNEALNALAVGHCLDKIKLQEACERLAPWMAAALDDPNVCAEMKTNIEVWLAVLHPTP